MAWGLSSTVRASGSYPVGWGFESLSPYHNIRAALVQPARRGLLVGSLFAQALEAIIPRCLPGPHSVRSVVRRS